MLQSVVKELSRCTAFVGFMALAAATVSFCVYAAGYLGVLFLYWFA